MNKYDFAEHICDMCKKYSTNGSIVFKFRYILDNIRYKNGTLIYSFYLNPLNFRLNMIKS